MLDKPDRSVKAVYNTSIADAACDIVPSQWATYIAANLMAMVVARFILAFDVG
jgi:hypothetical protein